MYLNFVLTGKCENKNLNRQIYFYKIFNFFEIKIFSVATHFHFFAFTNILS